ncbi:energy-coupling factor transporter transmembrane component T [Actinomadura sp. DC4]|uniref:energy-coupling factor transporter transmembrane component T n=1 Tax=Actinomadura sp. DC4 TaxID=3055069 RepID=UPI0025B14671|nr:energy-coupling factor transporter transmembrane component T [Actinomadura sp. DC4]MDN3353246.1 energy-coupling factor transporter transmembrane component T [Actinomadura sp. DC4]
MSGRQLHPGAWWLWALGLATAATRTADPLLLLLVVATTGLVVAVRRTREPWAGAYGVFLRLGLVVIVVRVVFWVVFAAQAPGPALFTLPSVTLPSWMAGTRVGGPVSADGLRAGLYDGLRLAAVLVCLGAANALASPSRLLKAVPGALYEMGVAVVVAMTFAPQAVTHVRRVRAAHRLRGRPDRGLRAVRGLVMPVIEGALERSVELAAAMDSRGYGRKAAVPAARRRATAALTLAGLLAVCAGLYGLLGADSPAALGAPPLVLGLAAASAGLWLGGRRSPRTRYRPDPWRWPEWAVSACGAAVAVATLAGHGGGSPGPPPVPAAALVLALAAALVSAPPVRREAA